MFNRFLFFVAWLSRCSLFKSCGASCLALSSVAGSQLCRRQSRKKGCCCHDRLGAVLVVSMVSSLRYGARRTVVSQEQRAQESAEATREKAVSWKIKPGDHPYRLHPRQPLEGCPSILVPLLSLCPSLCRDDRHPLPPPPSANTASELFSSLPKSPAWSPPARLHFCMTSLSPVPCCPTDTKGILPLCLVPILSAKHRSPVFPRPRKRSFPLFYFDAKLFWPPVFLSLSSCLLGRESRSLRRVEGPPWWFTRFSASLSTIMIL